MVRPSNTSDHCRVSLSLPPCATYARHIATPKLIVLIQLLTDIIEEQQDKQDDELVIVKDNGAHCDNQNFRVSMRLMRSTSYELGTYFEI